MMCYVTKRKRNRLTRRCRPGKLSYLAWVALLGFFFFFSELLEINRPMIGGFSYVHAHTRRRGEKKHACLLLFDFSFPTHSLLFHSFCILHKGKQRRQFTNHNKKKGSTIVHGTEPVIKGGSCETLFKLVNCLLFSPSTLSSKPNSKTGTDR